MWLKNAQFYRIDPATIPANLSALLAKRPFTRCNGLDWSSTGWSRPADHVDHAFTVRDCTLISLKREEKVLPGAVVRDFVDAKIAEIEAKELRKVGRKEKQALKEQVTDDLLPRAFPKASRNVAWLDAARGWIVIDSTTAARAETLISELREVVAGFPARLPKTQLSQATAMTAWLADGVVGNGFELDSTAWLKAPGDNGAEVKVSRMDLTSDELRQHIESGKQVTRLGLTWNEKISFVLTESLQLKRIQFLDVLQEEAAQAGDDAATLFEATFLLASAEMGELIDALVDVLGGPIED